MEGQTLRVFDTPEGSTNTVRLVSRSNARRAPSTVLRVPLAERHLCVIKQNGCVITQINLSRLSATASRQLVSQLRTAITRAVDRFTAFVGTKWHFTTGVDLGTS